MSPSICLFSYPIHILYMYRVRVFKIEIYRLQMLNCTISYTVFHSQYSACCKLVMTFNNSLFINHCCLYNTNVSRHSYKHSIRHILTIFVVQLMKQKQKHTYVPNCLTVTLRVPTKALVLSSALSPFECCHYGSSASVSPHP